MSHARSTLDGLPKQFVSSLRVLFDILDEDKSGYIKYSVIASHWEKEPVPGVPPDVAEALKKVTLSNGLLSFERFVAGIKIALLRNQKESKPTIQTKNFPYSTSSQPDLIADQCKPPPPQYKRQLTEETSRTKSLPHLGWEPGTETTVTTSADDRYAWRQQQNPTDPRTNNGASRQQFNDRRPGDGRSSVSSAAALFNKFDAQNDDRVRSKRREPRRHTLANGVDFNMIKRMKQLECERDILLQGMDAIEAAKQWYQQQLGQLEQKQKYVMQTPIHGEHSVEANQERISFQTARILEVNQQLRALLESSKKGYPFHMHLAVSKSTMERSETEKDNTIEMLKAQNKMLTKEVSMKAESVGKLEKEKAQLIKDMFQTRNTNYEYDNYDDTTFI